MDYKFDETNKEYYYYKDFNDAPYYNVDEGADNWYYYYDNMYGEEL